MTKYLQVPVSAHDLRMGFIKGEAGVRRAGTKRLGGTPLPLLGRAAG